MGLTLGGWLLLFLGAFMLSIVLSLTTVILLMRYITKEGDTLRDVLVDCLGWNIFRKRD